MRQDNLRRTESDRAAEQLLRRKGNPLRQSRSDCLVIQKPPSVVGKQGEHFFMLKPGEVGNYEAKKSRVPWIERMTSNVLADPGLE